MISILVFVLSLEFMFVSSDQSITKEVNRSSFVILFVVF